MEALLHVWKSRKPRGQSSRIGQLALGGQRVVIVVEDPVLGVGLHVKWVSVRDWKEVTVAVERVLCELVAPVTVTVVVVILVGVLVVGGGGQVVSLT